MTSDIAVVGLAGRFPGADDIASFWRLLSDGRDGTTRLGDAGEVTGSGARDTLVPVWAGLHDVEQFASDFFGFAPLEADLLDPQQRLLLEVSWHALEDAAIDPARLGGEVAVFASAGFNTYLLDNVLRSPGLMERAGRFLVVTSNDKDNVAARLAYKLDLRGPAMSVQSNCSSGLMGVHQAVSALLNHECDAALVAAAAVKTSAPVGYRPEPGGTSSPSGQCRAYDADADGYFLGDAVAAVVLRRQDDVAEQGDRAYAVIKGSAINNDGAAKVSFAATSKQAQVAVAETALHRAGLSPQEVHYVEGNGSATLIGDAIELTALAEVYGDRAGPPCRVGSLKPNVGNLDTVAGLGSLVKAVLALHHEQLPPSLHHERLNQHALPVQDQLMVNTQLVPWPCEPHELRRAAVSSFAVGGSNAHVVLEQACTSQRDEGEADDRHLLALSARTEQELRTMCEGLSEELKRPDLSLQDTSRTLAVGRKQWPVRTHVFGDREGLRAGLLKAKAVHATSWYDVAVVMGDVARDEEVHALAGLGALLAPRPPGVGESNKIAAPGGAFQLAVLRLLLDRGLRPRVVATSAETAGAVGEELRKRGKDADEIQLLHLPGDVPALLDEAPDAWLLLGAAPAGLPPCPGMLVHLLRDKGDAQRDVMEALGQLWAAGAAVDVSAVVGTAGRRTTLPGYPFTRSRHWIEALGEDSSAERENPTGVVDASARPGTGISSPLEVAVLAVWRHRLGQEDVPLDASLLDLGGDSLRAAQILSDVTDAFQVELSLRECLEQPTARAMSGLVARRLAEGLELRKALDAMALEDDVAQP